MHTAICTFEDRALAEQAVQRLEQAGFARHDIHMEHRHPDGSRMEERDSYGVGTFEFFERLFGGDTHAAHAGTYAFSHPGLRNGLYFYRLRIFDRATGALRDTGPGKMMVLN